MASRLTKAEIRTMIRSLLGNESSVLISDAILDAFIGITFDELWSSILVVNPFFVSQTDTLTTLVSPGYIDTRIVADGGQLSKRFYKLQTLMINERIYTQIDPRDVLLSANVAVVAPDYKYIFYGDNCWAFPLSTTTQAEMTYSFTPTKFVSLAETDAVAWPTGDEGVLVYTVVSRLHMDILKGEMYRKIAQEAQLAMISDIRSKSHFMQTPWTNQTTIEYGGT